MKFLRSIDATGRDPQSLQVKYEVLEFPVGQFG